MCQQKAAGTLWLTCGHFQRHMVTHIHDCLSVNCERSYLHPRDCRSRACLKVYGPDIQDIIDRVDNKCLQCQWQDTKAAQAAQAQQNS